MNEYIKQLEERIDEQQKTIAKMERWYPVWIDVPTTPSDEPSWVLSNGYHIYAEITPTLDFDDLSYFDKKITVYIVRVEVNQEVFISNNHRTKYRNLNEAKQAAEDHIKIFLS